MENFPIGKKTFVIHQIALSLKNNINIWMQTRLIEWKIYPNVIVKKKIFGKIIMIFRKIFNGKYFFYFRKIFPFFGKVFNICRIFV